MLLGYDSELAATQRLGMIALWHRQQDLAEELEENRDFVVLLAYDFQTMWKQRKQKLLWETRFSIRQRHNDFDQQLSAIAEYASRFFGQESHGLIRKSIPEGAVRVGDLKVLGVEPENN